MSGCGWGAGTWGGEDDAAVRLHCHFPSSIMRVYVAVLANLGTMHGNANGITRGCVISNRIVQRIRQGWVASARKMLFLPGSNDLIVRGNPTDSAMSSFVGRSKVD